MTVPASLRALAHVAGAPPYARRLAAPGRLAWTAADLAEARAMADRVLAVCGAATAAETAEGMAWYRRARSDVATAVPGRRVDVLARALAACSPGLHWTRNVAAVAVLADVRAEADVPAAVRAAGLPVAYGYRPFLAAWRALAGADVLRGPKVSAFADAVTTGGRTFAVCVDGHAALIAQHGDVAMRPGITSVPSPTGRRYDVLALAYALASVGTGYSPAQTQAIAWVAWRSRAIA